MILIMVKVTQQAMDGDIKAAEFIRDILGENPKYKIYEKRIELLAKETNTTSAIDDWVNAVIANSESHE